LRQCPSRYSIRAGRNLPDKEFRSVFLRRFHAGLDSIFIRECRQPRTVAGIHKGRYARDLSKPVFGQVPAFFHQSQNVRESPRVDALFRFEDVFLEKVRDFSQLIQTSDAVFRSISVISTDAPEPEEALQGVQDVEIALVLNDAELRNDLESDLDRRVSLDSDEEASFPIDEPNHPIRVEFHLRILLLLDARHIVSEDPHDREIAGFLRIVQSQPLLLARVMPPSRLGS
jgi:hypothetical protein